MFFVVEGTLEVRLATPGGATKILTILRPGATFGEMSLFGPQGPSEVDVVAVEASTIRVLPGPEFLKLCADPGFAAEVLRSVSLKAKFLMAQVYSLSFNDVRGRIIDLLNAMFEATDRPVLFISQETIASLVGAHSVTVSNVLRELQDSKAIALGRQRITLVDGGRLRDEALGA